MDYDNIFDALEAPVLKTVWEEKRKLGAVNVGEALFPHVKTSELSLRYMVGQVGAPVALKPSAFDTKATVRDHIGVSEFQHDMPFFREGGSLREKLRREFMAVAGSENKARYQAILARIYDDRTGLIDGAMVQAERMRTQLLQTGKILFAEGENRALYECNYDFPGAHTQALSGADMWDQPATSDPYETIDSIQSLMEPETEIMRAICSRATFRKMCQSEKLTKAIAAETNFLDGGKIGRGKVREYILREFGISFLVTQDKYCLEVGGTEYPYWEDGIVTFLPSGTLGNTHWGITPEEVDLMAGKSRASVAIVDKGIAVATYTEEHPVNHITIVSSIMMPSFEQINKVFIARVY
jgi:hypothetical protein